MKGFMTRKKIQPKIKEHKKQVLAATVIQAHYRSYAAQKERKRLLAEKHRLDELLRAEQMRIEQVRQQQLEEEKRRREEEIRREKEEIERKKEIERKEKERVGKLRTNGAITIQRGEGYLK